MGSQLDRFMNTICFIRLYVYLLTKHKINILQDVENTNRQIIIIFFFKLNDITTRVYYPLNEVLEFSYDVRT